MLRRCRMGFFGAGLMAGILLLMYCYMVGSGMSALRAVGMMLIYFLAQIWGRSYDMLNALGAMCIYLLWQNPFLLAYTGFWFSISALLGVGYVGPKLVDAVIEKEETLSHKRLWKQVLGEIWMSIGITLCTLPVVASSYYEIPLYASLVNMIALPMLTPIFLLAVLGGLIGLWVPAVAGVLFIPCEWLFCFYEWLCSCLSHLPGAMIICGKPSTVMIVLYYVILFAGVWYLDKRKEGTKGKPVLWCTGVCMVCFLLMLYPKAKPFEISFLDVGQGDGIYITDGAGNTFFIDGGSTSVDRVGQYRILPFLKSKGVVAIDYWFVTHADKDHISGLLEVLENGYQVKHLVIAKEAPREENLQTLLLAAQAGGTQVVYMEKGDQIETSKLRLCCLYPNDSMKADTSVDSDKNALSLVLQLEVKRVGKRDFRALFTGDITAAVEAELLQNGMLSKVDLYKAAHHGSKYSNSMELLETIRATYAVISCSEKNIYGHPSPHTIERMVEVGTEVLYTMKDGQIMIRLR